MVNKNKKILFIVIGVCIGILTGFLRGFSSSSFWSFSDIASRFGFWIFSVFLISFLSSDEREAFINSFLYMIFMCFSYYLFLYFNGHLYLKEFIFWGLFSIITSLYGLLINRYKFSDIFIIYSLPSILIGLEFIRLFDYFIRYRSNFLLMVIDFIGFICLCYLSIRGKGKVFKFKFFLFTFLCILFISLLFIILWSI